MCCQGKQRRGYQSSTTGKGPAVVRCSYCACADFLDPSHYWKVGCNVEIILLQECFLDVLSLRKDVQYNRYIGQWINQRRVKLSYSLWGLDTPCIPLGYPIRVCTLWVSSRRPVPLPNSVLSLFGVLRTPPTSRSDELTGASSILPPCAESTISY